MSDKNVADAEENPVSEKNPLQFKWVLWHEPPPSTSKSVSSKNWGDNLKQVASFDTVEDFWALFNNLQEPSQLPVGSSYNLFKEGIEPKWEDPANTNGGQWRVGTPSSRKNLLDQFWLDTILTTIGEGFMPDESDDIAGIVINIRKSGDRISIWTKSALNDALQQRLGRSWKKAAISKMRIEYITFKDQMVSGSRPRAKYVVG